MRVPLATTLKSRNGLVTKDAIIVNGVVESDAAESAVYKRPGNQDLGLVKAGTAQLLTYWNGIKTVIGDFFGTVDTAASATTLSPTDKSSIIALSNGDLTASALASGGVGQGLGRATVASTYYYEATVTSMWANCGGVGFATLALSVNNYLGADNSSIAFRNTDVVKNGIALTTFSATSTGDVLGVLYDTSVPSIKFYRNNTLMYTATGADVPSGTLYMAYGAATSVGAMFTVNFGATTFAYPQGSPSTNLSPTTAGLQFSAQDNGSNAGTQYLMLKNASQAWSLTNASGAVPSLITDTDYPGTYAVTLTSLTRSGTVATATTAADTNFQVGSTVTIAGASPSDYNGAVVVTAVTASNEIVSEPVTISITRSGTTATATSTLGPHQYTNGQTVTISGSLQSEYNGAKVITWLSATTFSFTVTVTGTDTASPATGSPAIAFLRTICSYQNTAAAPTVFSCTYVNPASASYFQNGDVITSSMVVANGTVSAATATTFTLTVAGVTQVYIGSASFFPATVPTISSITSSNGVATVTTSTAHRFATGFDGFNISGCTQAGYNLSVGAGGAPLTVLSSTTFSYPISTTGNPITPATGTITSISSTITGASFTYTVAGSPATPATGTITATGGRNTVPGIAYINGYFCVMDIYGVIYNSEPDNCRSWEPLNYTSANAVSGAGVALARSQNYVVAFKENSTEFFYDAKNDVGSPLSPVENGFTQVGCASGWSLAQSGDDLFWMARTRQKGRCIYTMRGTQQAEISSPDVERILNSDTLTGVYAYSIKINGHSLYVLTLTNTGITLVYDMTSKIWMQWTSLTIAASKSVSSITLVGTTATVTTSTSHGMSDGDAVTISGAVQSGYNGIWPITYVSATVFTIQVAAGLTTPATGTILAYPYTESYFKFTHFTDALGRYMVLHLTDGHLYEVLPTLYQDAGVPIPTFFRTMRLDGGSTDIKRMGSAQLIGDSVSDTAIMRFSDDDKATNSTYRPLNLALKRPVIRRCGAFERRTIEVKHIGNNPIRLASLELEIGA